MKVNYPFSAAVDWLQIYCKLQCTEEQMVLTEGVKVVVSNFPTPQFLKKAVFSFEKEPPFAEMLFQPRTSVLPACAAQLRVMNQHLYTENWLDRLRFILKSAHIKYVSLSRIDLAVDFNRLYKGLSPKTLLTSFIKGKFLKIGISKGFLHFDDWGYKVANNASSLKGVSFSKTPNITGCTWGSKGYVQTQIYNKSKELREVKYKPWIVSTWEKNGLDINEDVWRAEIRIQKQGRELEMAECLDTDVNYNLSLFEISNPNRIYETFYAYAKKYLRFVHRDYHVKKTQMKDIQLFTPPYVRDLYIAPKISKTEVESNKTSVIVRNFLNSLREQVMRGVIITPDQEASVRNLYLVEGQISALFGNKLINRKSTISKEVVRAVASKMEYFRQEDLFQIYQASLQDSLQMAKNLSPRPQPLRARSRIGCKWLNPLSPGPTGREDCRD